MHRVHSLLLPQAPYYYTVATTPSHPQLRDLLTYTPTANLFVTIYDTIAHHDLLGLSPPQYTRLRFHPSTLVSGMGLIAAGGQNGEIALRSADPSASWCYELNAVSNTVGHINNSIHISPSPLAASVPRLLVSNNDESIKVYEVAGRAPDFARARRRRERERDCERARPDEIRHDELATLSDGHERLGAITPGVYGVNVNETEDETEADRERGGECSLVKLPHSEIRFRTAINHCSVSPDGRRMVAVGDTNEIFLFDVMHNGDYRLQHTFIGSADASFSTDWSGTSDKFAVASQDGFVHLYDVRNLPPPDVPPLPTQSARKLRTFQTTQRGPEGAARKVKFSPGGVNSELLAFTEHQSKVHVIDARTFDAVQIIDVPLASEPLPTQTRSHTYALPIPSSPTTRPTHYHHRASPVPRARPSPLSAFRAAPLGLGDGPTPSFRVSSDLQHMLEDRAHDGSVRHLLQAGMGSSSSLTSEGSASSIRPRRWGLIPAENRSSSSPSSASRRGRLVFDSSDDDEGLERRMRDETGVEEDERHFDDDDDCPTGDDSRAASVGAGPSSNASGGSSSRRHATAILNSLQSSPPLIPSLSGYAPLRPLYSVSSATGGYVGASGYQATSVFFPSESSPDDLLGLDWDEWGEHLFVATEATVWEWEVDGRGRRCFGNYGIL